MKRLKQNMKFFNINYCLALAVALVGFMAPEASAQCPGTLVVNEISNGPNGNKEFVELIAASTNEAGCNINAGSVDVRGWIVDDNNGLFSGGAALSGLGISQGHYRLADNSIWENFGTGKLIVLFNFQDFDSTFAPFNTAAGNILSGGYLNTDSVIYVAVGISPLVVKYTATPAGDSTGGDPNYCTSNNSQNPASNYSGMSLRNSCGGDGIQVRCPGCSPEQGLSEPSWFHGISYGYDNDHRSNPNAGFLDAAHLAFDTVGGNDTLCGALRTFYLSQDAGFDPGVDANWAFGLYDTDATPGAPNTAANRIFIADIRDVFIQYTACPQPVESSVGKGVLVLTEISNGYEGECEYVELVVSACFENDGAQYVDIRGWQLDDNNGDFSVPRGPGSGKGITTGHLRLAFNDTWDSVKVGSIIVLFNAANDQNCYNFPMDKHTIPAITTIGTEDVAVYWEPVGDTIGNNNIESGSSVPNTSSDQYCDATYSAPASSWSGRVGMRNSTGDAFQVRCPGCNDVNPGEPQFYHGFGYGRSTSYFTIARNPGQDLGGPVFNTNSSSAGIKYVYDGSTGPFDISDVNNWDRLVADSLGIVTTAGTVPTDFYNNLADGTFALDWSCCGGGAEESRASEGSNYNNASGSNVNNAVFGGSDIVNNVYPNPTSGVLNMDLNIKGQAQLRLLDINGKVVLTRELTQDDMNISLDVNAFPRGVYFYQINADNGIASGKVMIK